jgi:hypothetical protein
MDLREHSQLYIKQRKEMAELFGFETRNKYEIRDKDNNIIAFAAEQGKGFLASIARHFIGHWRTFDISVFNNAKEKILNAHHPFRWFFQRLEISNENGEFIGSLQQRFSILFKVFDIEDPQGNVIMQVKSPLYKIWTFPVYRQGQEVAKIQKKWSGLLKETFLDADNFQVDFGSLTDVNSKQLLLISSIFVDLQYFERRAGDN